MTSVSDAAASDLDALRETAQTTVRDLRARKPQLDDDSIDLILRDARSHYAWSDRPVAREMLETIYDIMASGPHEHLSGSDRLRHFGRG